MTYWTLIQHGVCRYRFGLAFYLWLMFSSCLFMMSGQLGMSQVNDHKYGAAIWGGLILYLIMRWTHSKWNARSALDWHRRSVAFSIIGLYFLVSILYAVLWPEGGMYLCVTMIGGLLLMGSLGAVLTKREVCEKSGHQVSE